MICTRKIEHLIVGCKTSLWESESFKRGKKFLKGQKVSKGTKKVFKGIQFHDLSLADP